MAWIGWQFGMSGPPVRVAKAKLRAKFSYGKLLDDTELFDAALLAALRTFQTNTNVARFRQGFKLIRNDGVLDYATQVELGVLSRVSPVIFTVAGTGADHWTGFPADLARTLLDKYEWQPIGYPAAVFPMGRSVAAGRAELVNQIRRLLVNGRKGVLVGYSQGAMVTSMVWKHDIDNPNGVLHHLRDNIIGAVTYGNPCREFQVAYGNLEAGLNVPDGRGISDDRLVNTPSWWLDYAHGGNSPFGRDIYTDVPDDNTGEMMTAIYRVVQDAKNIFIGRDSLIEQFGEMATNPAVEIPAALTAIVYGGQFIITRPYPTLPHINYNIASASAYLRRIA